MACLSDAQRVVVAGGEVGVDEEDPPVLVEQHLGRQEDATPEGAAVDLGREHDGGVDGEAMAGEDRQPLGQPPRRPVRVVLQRPRRPPPSEQPGDATGLAVADLLEGDDVGLMGPQDLDHRVQAGLGGPAQVPAHDAQAGHRPFLACAGRPRRDQRPDPSGHGGDEGLVLLGAAAVEPRDDTVVQVGDEGRRGPGPQRRIGEVGADEVRGHGVGDGAELAVVGRERRLVGGVEPEQPERVGVLAGDPQERGGRVPSLALARPPVVPRLVRSLRSSLISSWSPGLVPTPVLRCVADDRVELLAQAGGHLLEDRPVELLLRGEDPVHDEPGDAGRAGHVVHRGAVEAGSHERRRGGSQDLGPAFGPREPAGWR